MSSVKISFVVPAHNEEERLGNCLDSIIRHGGKESEIIVVDNASTDNTAEVAKSKPGVRVIHERTKGPAHARETGWRAAGGVLIAFIDADNQLNANWRQILERAFVKDSQLVLLSGPYTCYDLSPFRNLVVWLFWHLLALPTYRLTSYMAVFGNLVIKREVLQRMDGINTAIEFYGDDTDLARRASRFGKVKFDRHFIILSSGRRLLKQGMLVSGYRYAINFLSEVVWKRPATIEYTDVR